MPPPEGDGRPGRRSLVVVLLLAVGAVVAGQFVGPLMASLQRKEERPVFDGGVVAPAPRPFPPLLRGLEADGGVLLDTTVREVDWRTGDSIIIRFERVEAPTTTLEVRRFSPDAPAPLAKSSSLAVYVVSPPDSGTAIRDDALARALGEFLQRAEDEGRPVPQLLPLTIPAR